MEQDQEYEITVSLVFGGKVFRDVFRHVSGRDCAEEHLDVYSDCRPGVAARSGTGEGPRYRYREHRRSRPGENGRPVVLTSWDRKLVRRYTELQVPYVDPTSRRVIFVTADYKSSTEERLTEDRWNRLVREDHSDASCVRTANKHRMAFPPESFADLFDGRTPEFTRLSIGEYSTYGGTLEARTKCNPVYYLEIESESAHEPAGPDEIGRLAEQLVKILFGIFPYALIAGAMRNDAAATVQRERTDNIFDDFKRRFVNYNRLRDELWKATAGGNGVEGEPVRLFVMPKWDGVRATANYCDGFLFVRDACGSLSTYRVDLPFDNDLMLQLEVVSDGHRKLLVVTEILAVVVKRHCTLYHVYSRNNTLDDTGRCGGNIEATSIALKTQFKDPKNRCNTYRLVAPLYSLLVMHFLGPNDSVGDGDGGGTGEPAFNTYADSDEARVILTTAAVADTIHQTRGILRILDRFHYSEEINATGSGARPVGDSDRHNRSVCLQALVEHLPRRLVRSDWFARHCEGLLVAFASSGGLSAPRSAEIIAVSSRHDGADGPSLPDHGYVKVKLVDTVDLEYRTDLGLATTASGRHAFHVRGVPEKFSDWDERPAPVYNNRVIIECHYDADEGCLVYVKDRPDKNRADGDGKIDAIDKNIIATCSSADARRRLLETVTGRCHE